MITASILSDIWCVVSNIHKYVIYACYSTLNAVAGAIEAIAQLAIDALPEMDEATDFATLALPGGGTMGTVLGWLNYVTPVDVWLETLAYCFAGMIVIWVVRIGLRIAKAES